MSATMPGCSKVCPMQTLTIFDPLDQSMPMPTTQSISPISDEARVSYLPWPKS